MRCMAKGETKKVAKPKKPKKKIYGHSDYKEEYCELVVRMFKSRKGLRLAMLTALNLASPHHVHDKK